MIFFVSNAFTLIMCDLQNDHDNVSHKAFQKTWALQYRCVKVWWWENEKTFFHNMIISFYSGPEITKTFLADVAQPGGKFSILPTLRPLTGMESLLFFYRARPPPPQGFWNSRMGLFPFGNSLKRFRSGFGKRRNITNVLEWNLSIWKEWILKFSSTVVKKSCTS